ncbi:hypothetical protein EPN18_08030 [bacterium]|nr:MAG: hypothetical protein EPN18_08030 [bacterium]
MAGGKNDSDGNYVLLRSNRRKTLRKHLLVLKVKGVDEKGVFFGYGKTLGRDGMFITTVNPKKAGEEFDICFKLATEDIEVKSRCRVVWARGFDPSLKKEPGMGIQFVDLMSEVRDKIDEFIKKAEK